MSGKTDDLPCPFCGGTDLVLDSITEGDPETPLVNWFMCCEDCGARGPMVSRIKPMTLEDAGNGAATYWNARRKP